MARHWLVRRFCRQLYCHWNVLARSSVSFGSYWLTIAPVEDGDGEESFGM